VCMEDVRLGRSTGFAPTQVTLPLAGTVTPLVQPNPKRIGLLIASSNGAPFNVAPTGITVSATAGIRIGARYTIGADVNTDQPQPLYFDIQTHGRLVCAGWNGASIGVADAIVSVTEIFLEKE